MQGRLTVNGTLRDEGKTDDPMGALAWVANLACEHGDPLKQGMIVITGSVLATLAIQPGEAFHFELDGVGETRMTLLPRLSRELCGRAGPSSSGDMGSRHDGYPDPLALARQPASAVDQDRIRGHSFST